MPEVNYEFSQEQNQQFQRLSQCMNSFSAALVLIGPILAGIGFYSDVSLRLSLEEASLPYIPVFLVTFMVGAVVTLLGVWLRRALKEFRDIVSTEGSDISHLMSALTQLSRFFQYGGALAWAMLALIVAALALQFSL